MRSIPWRRLPPPNRNVRQCDAGQDTSSSREANSKPPDAKFASGGFIERSRRACWVGLVA